MRNTAPRLRGRLIAVLALACLTAGVLPAAADPTAGAVSPNVEHLAHVPFDVGTATGLRIVGDYMYVTSWRHFSIYDISAPTTPELLSTRPFGFQYENEDVATNGEILLFAETAPLPRVHVWDVEDKTNPQEIATLDIPLANSIPGGEHTVSCILGCSFAYGSSGSIIDLRSPAEPKILGNWLRAIGSKDAVHDVDEVSNGLIVTSPRDTGFQVVDVRTPTKPKVLAEGPPPSGGWIYHGSRWPRKGDDNFLMMNGEGSNAPLQTFDARGWRKTKTFRRIDSFELSESAHWFQENPTFHNGGHVVAGWYGQGTRVLHVDDAGKIKEVGFFVPHVGNTWAAYWADDEIFYSVDLVRGIDILRFDPTHPQS